MSEVHPDSKRRLFFALWPADELRRQIEEATVGLARHSGGHVVPARNFHVTLVFIGDVLPSQVDAVIAAGGATSAPRFSMAFDQVEAWPRSNVLVLNAPRTSPELVTLVDHLLFNLLEKQVKLKREVYRPHVTLARNLPSLRPLQKIERIGWPVHEFALIESSRVADESRSDETRYTVLARWPLT
jgi:2'-5' RNA ligase